MAAPFVIKFGGELLEDPMRLQVVIGALGEIGARGEPLVIVHGGGKEIDTALAQAGIAKRQVDGLRITDEATLEVVVSVLAGAINTRFVATLNTVGLAAVGLTGADGACGLSDVAPAHRGVDGRLVDLGRVGVPSRQADVRIVTTLTAARFVPVIACIGLSRDGRLLNVNADTFAGCLAGLLGAQRLVVVGATPGVIDAAGATLRALDPAGVERLIDRGTATAGMVAKLRACTQALTEGVHEVVIVDGHDRAALVGATLGQDQPNATRLRADLGTCVPRK